VWYHAVTQQHTRRVLIRYQCQRATVGQSVQLQCAASVPSLSLSVCLESYDRFGLVLTSGCPCLQSALHEALRVWRKRVRVLSSRPKPHEMDRWWDGQATARGLRQAMRRDTFVAGNACIGHRQAV
jgi:hypothetical protein